MPDMAGEGIMEDFGKRLDRLEYMVFILIVERDLFRAALEGGEHPNEANTSYYKDLEVEVKNFRNTAMGITRQPYVKTNVKTNGKSIRNIRISKLTPTITKAESKILKRLREDRDALSKKTGIKHAIDHIWPIAKGGVNHSCNMQILTKRENSIKNATHDGKSGVSYTDFMLAVSAYA